MRTDLAWGTDSGTQELARIYRGPAVFSAETVEMLVHTKPDLTPAPRWSWLARALATFVAFDVVGIAYIAATSR